MDRQVKEIPIIMTCNYARAELVEQTLKSIDQHTGYPHRLIYTEDYERGPNKLNYLKLRNELADEIDFDYDYIVFMDDDIYCRDFWLGDMVDAYKNHRDVHILAGTTWPGHKILEKRDDISISQEFGGGCLIMSREIWECVRPWPINKRKTIMLWEKIYNLGGKIAVLNDNTKMIHCGARGVINRRGCSQYNRKRIKEFAKSFGVKTN